MKSKRARAAVATSWLACAWLACAGSGCSSSDDTGPNVPGRDGGPAVDATVQDASEGAPPPGQGGMDSAVAAVCTPTGAGPYWVVEGDPVKVALRCKTGLTAPAGTFAIDGLPAGAELEPTGTLSWTPTLSQAGVYLLTVRANPWNELGTLKIGVADEFDDPANVPIADRLKYSEELGLPVLFLQTDGNIDDDAYTPANIIYGGHEYVGTEAQYRGTFSQSFPKQSYTLKFTKDDKFGDASAAGGFTKKRKIVLVSPFNDNSYLRSRVVFDIWNAMDPAHILVRSYSAVVYLNGAYWGLYTVMDHIDEYLMEDFGLSQDGNLFKARQHDANYRLTRQENALGDPKFTLHDGYSKEEGLPADGEPGAYDDLDAIVNWVATATTAEFKAGFESKLNRKEYEDWFLLVSYLMANDSIGKNSYHYHDPALPSSLWRYIPWDMDESLGQNFATLRQEATEYAPEGGKYTDFNNLFARILNEPSFGTPLRQRYGSLLHGGAFDVVQIQADVDRIAAEIALAAERDQQKWGGPYQSFGPWAGLRAEAADLLTHQDEVAYVRKWVADRHAYIDAMY